MAQKKTLLSLFSSREEQGDDDLYPPSSDPSSFPNANNVKQILATADAIISKWDPDDSAHGKVTSLWCESREEAREFLRTVGNLQAAMRFLAEGEAFSPDLIRAQCLMQTAMKRLEKEFFQILSANRDCLDFGPSSTSTVGFSEDNNSGYEISSVEKSIGDEERSLVLAMADLRCIAECMTGSGYGNECAKIYTDVRKSIVEKGLNRLGIEPLSSAQIQKLDWELAELKIKGWTYAVKVAVKTLFSGERILCDHVFAASQSIRESCFADITKNRAYLLFAFPESIAKGKKSPEKIFRMLDLYEAIVEIWAEIKSVFPGESFTSVLAQAESSRIKLGEAVRTMLLDFEAAIQKDWSKIPVQGCAVHPLSRYVMNFLSVLADSRYIVADITAEFPMKGSLPGEIADCLNGDPISVRFAWLILLLLCKLDVKADLYPDVPLSYLFLANNLQYVIRKVENSDLRLVLGDSWIQMHSEKLRQYLSSFNRAAWSKSLAALAEIQTATSVEGLKNAFQQFNSAFDEACRMKTAAVVTDGILREELKVFVMRKIVPAYHSFYDRSRVLLRSNGGDDEVIRFSPKDLENYISDFFQGSGSAGCSGDSEASSHSS